jgi:FkbM family methyltransferase
MIAFLLRVAGKLHRIVESLLFRLQIVLAGRKANVDGIKLVLPAGVISTQMAYLLSRGGVDGEDRRLLKRYGRPNDFLLNLGGGSGLSAIAAYQSIQPGGTVVVVEPDPSVLAMARKNFAENGIDAIVSYQAAAVADRNQKEVTFFKKANYYGSNLFNTDHRGTPLTVPTIYPPDLVPQDHPGRKVLLCDVEGIEASLLAKPEVVDCFDMIMTELHFSLFPKDQVSPYIRMFEVLAERGFRLIDIDDEVFVYERSTTRSTSPALKA